MVDASVPDEVASLLRERVVSLDHLQVLLLLQEHRDREWTSDAIADALQMPAVIVLETLDHLTGSELVAERRSSARSTYVFAPASSQLTDAVAVLKSTFRHDPLGVMKILNEHALERVRARAVHAFADAFVLHRKRGKDG